MQFVRSFGNKRKARHHLKLLQQHFLVKEVCRKEIQIVGQPVAELEGKARSSGKVKVIKQGSIADRTQRCFGRVGYRFLVVGSFIRFCHDRFLRETG
jgi:hypothetical protein